MLIKESVVRLFFVFGILFFLFVACVQSSSDYFDKRKLKDYTEDQELKKTIAPILNQYWIYSKILKQENLKALVMKKSNDFKILNYSHIYGLLVEIDDSNATHLKMIKEIQLTQDIDNVYNRVYEGEDAFTIYEDKK